jgi:hypothetical protein
VRTVGIDETSLRRGQHYITVVHDLDRKRLLFATEGREHRTVVEFAEDLKAHGGDPAQVRHVCMDMSAAYAKGVALALPEAQISYDRFHVSMAIEAMDQVRRAEMATDAQAVRAALGAGQRRRSGSCGACGEPQQLERPPDPGDALAAALDAQSARAWRLKMALREVYARPQRTTASNRPHPTSGLAELGAALPARAVQEAGRHAQGAVRRGCAAWSITAATPSSRR